MKKRKEKIDKIIDEGALPFLCSCSANNPLLIFCTQPRKIMGVDSWKIEAP